MSESQWVIIYKKEILCVCQNTKQMWVMKGKIEKLMNWEVEVQSVNSPTKALFELRERIKYSKGLY